MNTSRGRILVGVDGSKTSLEALDWAINQARLTSSEVEIINTWSQPTSYGYVVAFDSGYDPEEAAREALEEVVAPVREANPDITLKTKTLYGEPRGALVDESAGADLLVVGSRGHGELTGMMLGSVSGFCVTHAKCPVVVIRPAK